MNEISYYMINGAAQTLTLGQIDEQRSQCNLVLLLAAAATATPHDYMMTQTHDLFTGGGGVGWCVLYFLIVSSGLQSDITACLQCGVT